MSAPPSCPPGHSPGGANGHLELLRAPCSSRLFPLLPVMTSGPSMPLPMASTSTRCCGWPRTRSGASRSPTSRAMPPSPGCTRASLARSGTPNPAVAAVSLCRAGSARTQLTLCQPPAARPRSFEAQGVEGQGWRLLQSCCVLQEGLRVPEHLHCHGDALPRQPAGRDRAGMGHGGDVGPPRPRSRRGCPQGRCSRAPVPSHTRSPGPTAVVPLTPATSLSDLPVPGARQPGAAELAAGHGAR